MVAITAVYVIATGFICWANIKSANASKAQLKEAKRQFDEETRLSFMPWLQVNYIPETEEMKQKSIPAIRDCNLQFDKYQETKTFDLEMLFYFSIRNIGHDVAVRTELHWEYNNIVTPSNGFAIFGSVTTELTHQMLFQRKRCE